MRRAGLHDQYKRDTAIFLRWLATFKTTSRPKSNSRKAKYDLSVNDIEGLIDCVAHQHPPPPIAWAVRRALSDAIEGRKEQTYLIEQGFVPASPEENNEHANFIATLEAAKGVVALLPLMQESSSTSSPKKKAQARLQSPMNAESEQPNGYVALELYEPVEEDDNEDDSLLALSEDGGASSESADFELEGDPIASKFAVHDFVEEIRAMHKCISRMLRRHVNKEVDVASLGLIVNTMITLIRTLEENVRDMELQCGGSENFIMSRYKAVVDQSPSHKGRVDAEPQDTDFINVGLLYNPETDLETSLAFITQFYNRTLDEEASLRTLLNQPEILKIYKNRDESWAGRPKRARYYMDLAVLLRIKDSEAVRRISKQVLAFPSDIITAAFETLNSQSCSPYRPFWALLAVKVFLETQRWGARTREAFNCLHEWSKTERASLFSFDDYLTKTHVEDDTIDMDATRRLTKQRLKLMTVQRDALDKLAKDVVAIHNPIACGLWLFASRHISLTSNLKIINGTGAILNTIHLRTALEQGGMGEWRLEWADIESVGRWFDMGDLFVLPDHLDVTDHKPFCKFHYERNLMLLGFSAVQNPVGQPNPPVFHRRSHKQNSSFVRKELQSATPILDEFAKIYDLTFTRTGRDKNSGPAFSPYELGVLFQKLKSPTAVWCTSSQIVTPGGKRKRHKIRDELPPFVIFDRLLWTMRSEMRTVLGDLLSLEMNCLLLYRCIRDEQAAHLRQENPKGTSTKVALVNKYDPFRINHELFQCAYERVSDEWARKALLDVKDLVADCIAGNSGGWTMLNQISGVLAVRDPGVVFAPTFAELPSYEYRSRSGEFRLMGNTEWTQREARRMAMNTDTRDVLDEMVGYVKTEAELATEVVDSPVVM